RLGKRPPCATGGVDTSRSAAVAAGSSVCQARKTLGLSRFCALTGTCIPDRRPLDDPLHLVTRVLHARNEPATDSYRSFRDDAVALCVHRPRNQTIILRLSGGLFGIGQRKNRHVAKARSVFGNLCPGDIG